MNIKYNQKSMLCKDPGMDFSFSGCVGDTTSTLLWISTLLPAERKKVAFQSFCNRHRKLSFRRIGVTKYIFSN